MTGSVIIGCRGRVNEQVAGRTLDERESLILHTSLEQQIAQLSNTAKVPFIIVCINAIQLLKLTLSRPSVCPGVLYSPNLRGRIMSLDLRDGGRVTTNSPPVSQLCSVNKVAGMFSTKQVLRAGLHKRSSFTWAGISLRKSLSQYMCDLSSRCMWRSWCPGGLCLQMPPRLCNRLHSKSIQPSPLSSFRHQDLTATAMPHSTIIEIHWVTCAFIFHCQTTFVSEFHGHPVVHTNISQQRRQQHNWVQRPGPD